MKILYFLNAFNRGGAEFGLLNLVEGGLFADCDLTVACIVRGSGEMIEPLAKLGVVPIVFADRRTMRVRDLAMSVWRLVRLIRRTRPDALMLSLPQANIVGRVVGFLARVPTIVSFEHNTRLARPVYEFAYRLLAPLVDVAFVDCEATWSEVAKRRYPGAPPRHFVVPLISFAREPPGPKSERASAGPRRVISVGRLTPVKGHHIGIEAVAMLKHEGVDVEFHIVGEGERREALGEFATRLGVGDRVRFLGFVPAWWEGEDYQAFVLTSEHEGLCIAALEAMWSGIPVIATQVGGIRDYGSSENMILLPERTPRATAIALKRLLGDPALARRLSTHAQSVAMGGYGAAEIADRYARLNASIRAGFI